MVILMSNFWKKVLIIGIPVAYQMYKICVLLWAPFGAEILNKSNCRNIINYNKKHDKKLGYIIFIIDELVQLTTIKKCKDELQLIIVS